MIVRVLNARVQPGRVGQFNSLMRRHLEDLRKQPGLEYVKLARRLEADGGEELILFEEWRDASSLYAWVGHDLTRVRLRPGSEESISGLTVAHYEALDMVPAEIEPEGTYGRSAAD